MAQRAMSISTRASANLNSSKLGEIRSHCFRNQYDPASNPDGIIALAIAENKLMRDEITAHINANFKITPWHLTYGDGANGSRALKNAISEFMNEHFKPVQQITKDHIVVCNGAGTAVNNLCFCLGEPGDGILLGVPYYTGFVPDIEAYAKFKLLGVTFGSIDPLSPEAVPCYEAALNAAEASGTRVRALLLANPHVRLPSPSTTSTPAQTLTLSKTQNPLGRPYPPTTLLALMRLCTRHNIHLISDEVYCLSHFSSHDFPTPPPFTSVLSLLTPSTTPTINPSLMHIIYGMSKDFCANGVRIGCTVSPFNTPVLSALKSIASFSRPSQLAEHVWLNLLTDLPFQRTYFPELQRRMGDAYAYVTGLLRGRGIWYSAASVSSFLWIDLRRYLGKERTEEAELALNWRMAREARVWVGMGRAFEAEECGWYRLTFATPREELEMGMERLLGLLGQVEGELKGKGEWVG